MKKAFYVHAKTTVELGGEAGGRGARLAEHGTLSLSADVEESKVHQGVVIVRGLLNSSLVQRQRCDTLPEEGPGWTTFVSMPGDHARGVNHSSHVFAENDTRRSQWRRRHRTS